MRSTRTAAVSAALLSLTFLAGCGGGDGDDDKKSDDKVTETVTPTPSETPTTEATAPTTDSSATPMDPTGDVTQEQLDAALLTAEEVGAGFVLGTYTDTDDPPLCDPDGTPLDEQFPPQVTGGVELDHSDGIAAIQEELAIYESDEAAATAFAAGLAGLNCTDGTTGDGTAVTIGAPQDVTANVDTTGLGTSTAYEITSESFQGVLIVTLAHRVILATSFAATPDADTSAFPNPIDVQAAAFAKALAN
ncbi:hypothetical protein F0U44_18380 [Nocardioides humilatus]|uniref:PknH-like extracellular domain-containing protein n=1 Tax=Nocardioides humilatus TaxID=2607660 RepID=A0A5B1LA39_9ACTN|nr:hypothetical protein [Nocardioides humilatus]KAA1417134.1 hypothetical protein F0U44_18380 [Nocardioides humilatus]